MILLARHDVTFDVIGLTFADEVADGVIGNPATSWMSVAPAATALSSTGWISGKFDMFVSRTPRWPTGECHLAQIKTRQPAWGFRVDLVAATATGSTSARGVP